MNPTPACISPRHLQYAALLTLATCICASAGLLFKATFTKNRGFFVKLLVQDIVGQLLFSGLKSTIDYTVARLALRWRAALNSEIEGSYFKNMAYVASFFYFILRCTLGKPVLRLCVCMCVCVASLLQVSFCGREC